MTHVNLTNVLRAALSNALSSIFRHLAHQLHHASDDTVPRKSSTPQIQLLLSQHRNDAPSQCPRNYNGYGTQETML